MTIRPPPAVLGNFPVTAHVPWVMSVVAGTTRRRWSVVAAGVAALVGIQAFAPTAAEMLDGTARPVESAPPETLVERALQSADVAHLAVAEIRGSLGTPDLPRLTGLAALLGGTTRARVWWSSTESWRVDTLTDGGEVGTYGVGDTLVVWDYGRSQRTTVTGAVGARLPRADDLLPPQAVRRLLAGVGGAAEITALPDRWIAGRVAAGVRVAPGDSRSTVERIDIWTDPGTGLPLELHVVDRDGADALVSRYLDVTLGPPAGAVLTPPNPPLARRQVTSTPDLAAAVDADSPWDLPDALAGLPASRTPLRGVAVYGDGLVSFAVLPLPSRLAADASQDALEAGAEVLDVGRGEAALVTSSLLNVAVARGPGGHHGYLVAGFVTADTLEAAVAELLADPPRRRDL